MMAAKRGKHRHVGDAMMVMLARRAPPHRPAVYAAILLGIAVAALLICLQLYLQNVHIATTNGLWKSIAVRDWMTDPGWHRIDFSNALYFPVQAMLCRTFDALGVFRGLAWRQLAVSNGLAGGVGVAAIYLFLAGWLRDQAAALLGTMLYVGTGFYLLLSLINEDIMPGAVLVLIASLLACAWFAQPTFGRIALVAVLFSLGWLWEWRLLFPSLPAMLLALFLANGSWSQRICRPAGFMLAMCMVPALLTAGFLVMTQAHLQSGAHFLARLFWAGKGVGTGWGGFAGRKVILTMYGLGESILGGRNISDWLTWYADRQVCLEVAAGMAIILVLTAISVAYAWRNRTAPLVRNAVVLLGGTGVAGIVFNLYSQPQDPQMVINVTLWTIPGWGLLARVLLAIPLARPALPRRLPQPARLLSIVLFLGIVGYNLTVMAAQRGWDRDNQAIARQLAERFDQRGFVFLYQGFEGITAWQCATYGCETAGEGDMRSAPAERTTAKLIFVTNIPVLHPKWTRQQMTAALEDRIDMALARGYQVVAGPMLIAPDDLWVASLVTVATSDVALALRAAIVDDYTMTPALDIPPAGVYSILTRRSAP